MVLFRSLIYLYNLKYFIYFTPKSYLINPNEKYYIAANLYNNEEILPDWISEMKKLISYLGEQNVYISIYENGDSNDKTVEYLKDFRTYLNSKNISNNIFTEHVVDKFKFPRIDEELKPGEQDTEEKKNERFWKTFYRKLSERISFLAVLRNKAMDFLYKIPNLDYNNTRVLFFNDIIYNYQDIIKLISTNKRDYDVACGMDFYWAFYDALVSIDLNGHRLKDHFPYFTNKAATDAFLDGDNIRVFSCWNGVVSARAKVFENKQVTFRNISKKQEIPVSECTLFNYDNYKNGFGKVLINPNVYVGYNYLCYYSIRYFGNWFYEPWYYFPNYLESLFLGRDESMVDMKSPIIPMNKNLTNLTEYMNYQK